MVQFSRAVFGGLAGVFELSAGDVLYVARLCGVNVFGVVPNEVVD